jgi:hypothetical protein
MLKSGMKSAESEVHVRKMHAEFYWDVLKEHQSRNTRTVLKKRMRECGTCTGSGVGWIDQLQCTRYWLFGLSKGKKFAGALSESWRSCMELYHRSSIRLHGMMFRNLPDFVEQNPSSEANLRSAWSRNFPLFVESEGLLWYLLRVCLWSPSELNKYIQYTRPNFWGLDLLWPSLYT